MELDDNSGRVVQTIRDLGLAENTLVIGTTDNGAWVDAWPDAGYTPFRSIRARIERLPRSCDRMVAGQDQAGLSGDRDDVSH